MTNDTFFPYSSKGETKKLGLLKLDFDLKLSRSIFLNYHDTYKSGLIFIIS